MNTPNARRLHEIYEAARLHHVEGLNKTEVANRLATSSTQIGRFLAEAVKLGIVKTEIRAPRIEGFQNQLVDRFPCLREIIVIAASGTSQYQLETLGRTAAEYFDAAIQRIREEHPDRRPRVGVSGGNTMFELIQALERRDDRDIEIYPSALIGRGPFVPEHIDPMVLITMLWERSGRQKDTAYYVTVPPFEQGTTPRAVVRENTNLLKRKKVRDVWARAQDVDIIFASVGSFQRPAEPSVQRTLIRMLEDISITQRDLEREGIIGDLSYSTFNKAGKAQHLKSAQGDLFITLGIKRFQEMAAQYPRRRVVLVAGQSKEEVLAAALRGAMCNILITDDITAEKVLKAEDAYQLMAQAETGVSRLHRSDPKKSLAFRSPTIKV